MITDNKEVIIMSEVTAPIMTDATGQSIDSRLNSLLTKMDNLAAAFQPNASGIVYSNTTSGLTGDDVQEAIDEMAADVSEIKQSLSNLVKYIEINETTNAYGTITVNIPASKPIISVQIYEPNGNYFGIVLIGSASASSQWIRVKKPNDLTNVASTAVTGKVFYLDI